MFVFINLRGKKRKREYSHLLIHSPEAHNSQDWAALKLGAMNSIQDSHMRVSPHYLDHYLCFPGFTLAGTWSQELETKYSDVGRGCFNP